MPSNPKDPQEPAPTLQPTLQDNEVVLGETTGVFGVRGELRVFLYNREGETLKKERPVVLVDGDGNRREYRMQVRSGAGKRILARIVGITTPEAAEALVGRAIVIEREVLPVLEEGEYYLHDLIGLPVEDESGKVLGFLEEVVEGPEKDIWVIQPEAGEPLFVVAGKDTIVSITLKEKIVVCSDAVG
jgi:16S rRNA processing protein RimM